MFDIVLLNSIFILIPLLCYLIYIVYENVFGIKGNNFFFSFAIITSLYLITKYSVYFNYRTDIIKILLLICMLKNKKLLSIFIMLYMSIYLSINNNYNIIFLLLEYLIQLLIFFNILKNTKDEYKITVFLLIEIISEIVFKSVRIDYILLSNIICVFISYILYKLLIRIENIINIYGTIRQVEYEKNFRESLFKVTHEIKNPIAVCKGYLDMLDTGNEKQVKKYIPIVKSEIDRTLKLMTDFLNLNKLSIDKSILDISMLLEDISSSIENYLRGKNIKYVKDIVDDEVFIEGDYDRLKQVFINLVKNSVESIEKDGVIKLKVIIKDKVIVILEDNGKGMDSDTLKRVGEPFFTTKEKGTGLGVKLSTEIIELHDGSIKYSSKLNKGTTVKIELPLYK